LQSLQSGQKVCVLQTKTLKHKQQAGEIRTSGSRSANLSG